MANVVEVRGVRIGEGLPKIIVPIVGKTKEEILASAKSFAGVKLDLVEWRVDWFEGVFEFEKVEDVLKDLRAALAKLPESIIRAKGIVPADAHEWLFFDYVPGESDVRIGASDVTGKIVVIGSGVNKEAVKGLFGI